MNDDKIEVFEASDFYATRTMEGFHTDHSNYAACAARIANAKIKKLMGPKVYGYGYGNPIDSEWHNKIQISTAPSYKGDLYRSTTHTAYLFSIQPIEKKECEHEYDCLSFKEEKIGGPITTVCVKCGAKLKAKWEVAE